MKIKILSILIFIFSINLFGNTTGFPKEYYDMRATIKKQIYFFDFLYPHIENANKKILEERKFVNSLATMNFKPKNDHSSYEKLTKIAKKYKVKDVYDYKTLLTRVDIVPASMALAQAAVESGWGTSRFAKLGNNLFGHWTWGKKGIMPLNRDKNAKHLVRIFDSFEDSIAAYMLNLNRTNAYKSFRHTRSNLRSSNQEISGMILSQTMINYSQIREKYLKILKNVIRKNKLETYDTKLFETIKKENYEI